ncbi:MAG: GntR family transcriptional regulator [Actinomycetota bacterium]|nr:GntR family transcriptional regulator [Actinomycetota bacterium]
MPLRPGDGARTLADVALAELREAIVSGEIPPGSPIRLQEYVDRLSMSTVPIREALRFLEQKGLIERRPHRGVVVCEMSATDLEDTYKIRLDLESMAVRMAVPRIKEKDRILLLGLVDEYEAALRADNGTAPDVHTKLHMSIYEYANSRWLRLLLPSLWDNSERYRRLQIPVRGTIEQRVEEHRLLVEACASGDPEVAATELQAHLSRTMVGAIALLREQEGNEAIAADLAAGASGS